MAAPFPLGLSLLEVDDERNAVLQEVDAAATAQLRRGTVHGRGGALGQLWDSRAVWGEREGARGCGGSG